MRSALLGLAGQVEQHVVLGERDLAVGELGAELPEHGDLRAVQRLPGVDGVGRSLTAQLYATATDVG